jgi:hypothetical protein
MAETHVVSGGLTVSISRRSYLVPGVALAATGVVAFGPSMVAPPAVTLAQPAVQIPAVHVAEVQLAGFAMDLYYALEGWAAFGVQVLQDFLFWAPDLAAQVGVVYQSFEPIIEAAVKFVVGLIEAPTDLLGAFTSLVSSVFGIAPSAAAATLARPAAARTGQGASAAAADAPALIAPARAAVADAPKESPAPAAEPEASPEALATIEAPAPSVRAESRRAARAAGTRPSARAAAATAAESVVAGAPSTGDPRPATRAGRGASGNTGGEGRASTGR